MTFELTREEILRTSQIVTSSGIANPRVEEISGAALALSRIRVGATKKEVRQLTGQVAGQVAEKILRFCRMPRKAPEIQNLLELKHRETFQDNYLKPVLERGWIELSIPDKPKSRLQRYRITEAGQKALDSMQGER